MKKSPSLNMNDDDDVASQVQSKINELKQSMKDIKELNKNVSEMFKNDPTFLVDSKYYPLDKTDNALISADSFFSKHERSIAARNSFNQNVIDKCLRTVLEGLVTLSSTTKKLKIVYYQIIAAKSVTEEFRGHLEIILCNMENTLKLLSEKWEELNIPVPSNAPIQSIFFDEIEGVTDSKVKSQFDEYLKVAKYTSVESPEYKEIFDGIIEIVKNFYISGIDAGSAKIQSFASIVGPSFMGKTQFAFSLARAFKVFYVNFSKKGELQPIYKAFEIMSDIFISHLFDDCDTLESKIKRLDSDKLSSDAFDIQLLTIGFIWNLVEHSLEYDPSKSEWFEYYLKPREFQFKAMSIGEYLVNLSKF